MTAHATFAALKSHHTDTAAPVCFQPCLSIDEDPLSFAPITALTPRSAALLQLGRELTDLRAKAARMRNLRRMRQASLIEADVRRVVLAILAWGRS